MKNKIEDKKITDLIPDSENANLGTERRIEYLPLAELVTRLHPQNPKDHNIGAIIESYKTHGYVASGVIDSRTGLFLAGHGRTIALNMMQKQGMDAPDGIRNDGDDWLVPVQVGYKSKNDVQAKAYIVADNKLTIAGGWDEPALVELLQEVAASTEIALESTGFSGDELDTLLSDLRNDVFDTNSLPDMPEGDLRGAYLLYVTFSTRNNLARAIKLLTLGERAGFHAVDNARKSVIDGDKFIDRWHDGTE